jgi:hypothetical protein
VDDEIGGLPNWSERPRDEQRELALRIASREKWVLDTAYGHWRDIILPRTELIVALDYPRQVSLAWLLRRTARRIVTGEFACNGNKESSARPSPLSPSSLGTSAASLASDNRSQPGRRIRVLLPSSGCARHA